MADDETTFQAGTGAWHLGQAWTEWTNMLTPSPGKSLRGEKGQQMGMSYGRTTCHLGAGTAEHRHHVGGIGRTVERLKELALANLTMVNASTPAFWSNGMSDNIRFCSCQKQEVVKTADRVNMVHVTTPSSASSQ